VSFYGHSALAGTCSQGLEDFAGVRFTANMPLLMATGTFEDAKRKMLEFTIMVLLYLYLILLNLVFRCGKSTCFCMNMNQ